MLVPISIVTSVVVETGSTTKNPILLVGQKPTNKIVGFLYINSMSVLKLNYEESPLWFCSDVLNSAKSAGFKTREAAILNWLKTHPSGDVIVGKNVKVDFEVDGDALLKMLRDELRGLGQSDDYNPVEKLLGDDRGTADFIEKVNRLLLESLAKVNVSNTHTMFEGQLVYPREINQLKG